MCVCVYYSVDTILHLAQHFAHHRICECDLCSVLAKCPENIFTFHIPKHCSTIAHNNRKLCTFRGGLHMDRTSTTRANISSNGGRRNIEASWPLAIASSCPSLSLALPLSFSFHFYNADFSFFLFRFSTSGAYVCALMPYLLLLLFSISIGPVKIKCQTSFTHSTFWAISAGQRYCRISEFRSN